jgi:hypothetical protein
MSIIKHVVSFSQLSKYVECPFQWFLHYIKKIKDDTPSIHLLFGKAFHEVVQAYLKAVFEQSVKYADSLDLAGMLKYRMAVYFKEMQEQYSMDEPVTKNEMIEFYYDGLKILEWLKKHRADYFNTRKYRLMGVEIPLEREVLPGVNFTGFVDILLQDIVDEKVLIIDLKTSTYGWRGYQKTDENKSSQLVLYKMFFSEQFNIPLDKISVEFIILKRKLYENMDYPQKRIQRIVPASGKPTMNKVKSKLDIFLQEGFNLNGDYKEDGFFPKIATDKNCRFCYFNDKPHLCNKKN